MKIVTRNEKSAVAVLDLEGPLTVSADTQCISNTLNELLRLGVERIVMNMAGVSYLDCAGIGKLLEFREHIISAGGCLKLTELQPKQRILLDLFRLTPVLGICESERTAVASFFQPLEPAAFSPRQSVLSLVPSRGVAAAASGRNTAPRMEAVRMKNAWSRG
jgi:anti-sigma B factor antagonist